MRISAVLLLLFVSLTPVFGEDAAPAAPDARDVDFLRVDEDEEAARLQTSVTRYEKDGVTVELLGAVHIADKEYYDELNRRFAAFDALLFEMIGGENLVNGKAPVPAEDEEPDLVMDMLGKMYDSMAKFLKLTGQKDGIDYAAKNFVHADLTVAEFVALQEERGESLLGFALAAGRQMEENPDAEVRQPNMARLLTAFLAGNANALKMEIIHTLGQGDDQISALAGENVIIHDRNAKCLKVLDAEIAKGRKNLGIFYGAAHYPDMEERLLKQGWKRTGHEWLTAWDVPKPKRRPKALPGKQAPPKKAA
ncbi:MAG: hypothetical protein HKN82_19950 [Akkermansiaceae bacterium]|nr:hypothetical protein [Akkermansiaceae bacterium]NNM31167.1 hypothetical protein [Akkermansiaceae bacterium]